MVGLSRWRFSGAAVAAVVGLAVLLGSGHASTASFTGTLTAGGQDWATHVIDVPASGAVTLTLDWDLASANLNLFLYDPDGALVAFSTSATAKPEVLTYPAGRTGSWRAGVKAKSGGTTGYRLEAVVPDVTTTTTAPDGPRPQPEGFSRTVFVGGLTAPTAMAWAPDGRLFVTEESGDLRVVEGGQLLSQPFVRVDTEVTGERGLLGVALDPQFATNGFVYVYYTVPGSPPHNRVSRFTADGDVARPGSERVLLDLPGLGSEFHNGGALAFGPDGRLYVAVGENAVVSNAQSLSTPLGKVLRIGADGSIPADNPFFTTATGLGRATYALGLRNPFTMSFRPGTGQLFVNDVGAAAWEEVNAVVAGGNYGWPATEGYHSNPAYLNPLYAYPHGTGPFSGCAITGSAFSDPARGGLPAAYTGRYFFGDFCGSWINMLDPSTAQVSTFATNLNKPVGISQGPDGALYVLNRKWGGVGIGDVVRFAHTGATGPVILEHPAPLEVVEGEPATFSVSATGTGQLRFQWRRDGVDVPNATASSYTLPAPRASDSGAVFSVVVSDATGSQTSDGAVLTVLPGSRPTGAITSPPAGTTYAADDVVVYAGTATDPDEVLGPDAFTWWVEFHHADHTHPFIAPTTGTTGGSFRVPTVGETATDVFFRIHLLVTDSVGATHESTRDVSPRVRDALLTADPPGVTLALDGQPVVAPHAFSSVENMTRVIGAPSPQTHDGGTWIFSRWSDGGAREHAVAVPASGATFAATYTRATTSTFVGTVDAAATYWRTHNVAVSGPGRIVAVLDWADPSANLNLFLYDPSGTLVASATSRTARPERIAHDASAAGTYRLGIRARTGASSYTLTVEHP